MNVYCTYEHQDNGMEPAAMTLDEYSFRGGAELIKSAECYVWQYAESEEQALIQHIKKHDEWESDQANGRPEKDIY